MQVTNHKAPLSNKYPKPDKFNNIPPMPIALEEDLKYSKIVSGTIKSAQGIIILIYLFQNHLWMDVLFFFSISIRIKYSHT